MPGTPDETILHASCVAWNDRAVLITGASGQGKSALALSLMAMGADLVSDDRTRLHLKQGKVIATAPAAIKGLIEARGIGILTAHPRDGAEVVAVVDLDQDETERLPQVRKSDLLGQSVTLFWNVDAPHFAPALLQFLKSDRRTR